MSPHAGQEKWRVLFVVDSLYWVSATIVRQICRYNPWIEPTLCSASALRQILKLHSGLYPGEIDLVHFLTTDIAVEFMPVFHPSTPCIVTNHHFEGNTSLEPYHTADAVMTVSRQWHEEILARGVPSEKCVMVSNGVDVELFKPPSREQKAEIRKKFGFEQDRIYIGFSGKRSSDTSKRKGVDVLVKAIQSLSRTKEIGLAIIGPGWDDLVREQRQRGIACVYIPFLVDRSDVADFYKAIDIYWVTSKIEGGPVPLLEAMSSEVACVSTPVGLALEAIESGVNAITAPFDSPEFFARTTEDLLDNPDKMARLGRAARKTIVERFQASQTTRSVGKLYEVAARQFKLRGGQAKSRPPFNAGNRPNSARVEPMLASLPRGMHARITAAEHLEFMQYLMYVGATNAAIRLGVRAIRTNPMQFDVWRQVGRRIFQSVGGAIRFCCSDYKKLAGWLILR